MKIAVINISGNVGKSTIAGHLLKPRMNGAQVYSIESMNADLSNNSFNVERIKARRFGELQAQLILAADAIIDIGASNVEEFLALMQQYDGSHEEFDYFLVPTTNVQKQQADTINTIRILSGIGVPSEKIRLIFNKVAIDQLDDLREDFAALFGFAQADKSFQLCTGAVIHENEIFELVKSTGKTLDQITSDSIDYREKLRAANSDEEKAICVRMILLKRLAITANKNLDVVFANALR